MTRYPSDGLYLFFLEKEERKKTLPWYFQMSIQTWDKRMPQEALIVLLRHPFLFLLSYLMNLISSLFYFHEYMSSASLTLHSTTQLFPQKKTTLAHLPWRGIAALCSLAQSCPTLWPHGLYPASSSVHGILQARMLEWAAMPSSRGSSQPRDQTQVSCLAGDSFTVWTPRKAQEY